MATLHLMIMKAYCSVTKTQANYRIQDLVDWINNNGGVNGYAVSRDQVKRGILAIIDAQKKRKAVNVLSNQ